jgi:hypothetical protein
LDFHHDWKAWSGKERATVTVIVLALTFIVGAWVIV